MQELKNKIAEIDNKKQSIRTMRILTEAKSLYIRDEQGRHCSHLDGEYRDIVAAALKNVLQKAEQEIKADVELLESLDRLVAIGNGRSEQ